MICDDNSMMITASRTSCPLISNCCPQRVFEASQFAIHKEFDTAASIFRRMNAVFLRMQHSQADFCRCEQPQSCLRHQNKNHTQPHSNRNTVHQIFPTVMGKSPTLTEKKKTGTCAFISFHTARAPRNRNNTKIHTF
jgi:hypothetical protein